MPSPVGASPSPVTIPPVEVDGDAAPAGVAAGLAAVAELSYSEGQKLRALYNCLTK
jgi:hypothetical protein